MCHHNWAMPERSRPRFKTSLAPCSYLSLSFSRSYRESSLRRWATRISTREENRFKVKWEDLLEIGFVLQALRSNLDLREQVLHPQPFLRLLHMGHLQETSRDGQFRLEGAFCRHDLESDQGALARIDNMHSLLRLRRTNCRGDYFTIFNSWIEEKPWAIWAE